MREEQKNTFECIVVTILSTIFIMYIALGIISFFN